MRMPKVTGRGRLAALSVFPVAAFLVVTGTEPAQAVPVATALVRAECEPGIVGMSTGCCASFAFYDASFDVFGTPVNLGVSVGTVATVDAVVSNYDGNTADYDGTFDSLPAGLLGFDGSGSSVCGPNGCPYVSYVGPVTNVSGSVGLPAGPQYTMDGTLAFLGPIPMATIPGCSLTGVNLFEGPGAINAFQSVTTTTGTNVTVSNNTTFFDSSTGTAVPVSIDVTYGQVTGTGSTVVTAFSNAAGEIPGNFAAQVDGKCADNPSVSCCADSDCTTGICEGCYKAVFADVTTTAAISPPIEICSYYQDADDDGIVDGSNVNENALSVLHNEGGVFVDRTSQQNTDLNFICAEVNSLSFFVVAAAAPGCPEVADSGCTSGFSKGFLLVRDVSGKEKIIGKWIKGPALSQTDMGNPLAGGSGTAWTMCIYDQSDALVGQLVVDRAGDSCSGRPCWKSVGKEPPDPAGKGYKYKDAALSSDGVQKIIYKGGTAGHSKAILKGKGSNIPSGIAAALQSSTQATIQLRSSDGECLSAVLTDRKKNDVDFYKIK